MKKFVVSEDTEVVLNGKKFLLESGDGIMLDTGTEKQEFNYMKHLKGILKDLAGRRFVVSGIEMKKMEEDTGGSHIPGLDVKFHSYIKFQINILGSKP